MSKGDRLFYKIGEVCERTGTQPYVLRFWESEFPMLRPRKNRAGQRVYEPADIELIERIKTLLYEEEYTIAGARRQLEDERRSRAGARRPPRAPAPPPTPQAAGSDEAAEAPGVAVETQIRLLREERSTHAREAHLARTEADELRRRLEGLERQVGEDGTRGLLASLRQEAAHLREELDDLARSLREGQREDREGRQGGKAPSLDTSGRRD